MWKATLLALVWVLIAAALPARALEAPLPMDEAFVPAIENAKDGSLTITWRIAEGYYLYRDYLAAADSDGQTLSLKTESGTIKDDPGFGATEVYYDRASASVVNAPPTFRLTYQGCQDGGLCYPPQTRTIDRAAMTISGPSEGLLALPVFSEGQGTKSVDGGLTIASGSNDTAVDRLLVNGGLPLLIAGFLGFGLLLAFTPCVFPMYPIVAAMLSRQGGTMTARRGFMLATSYVIALALAFALFGMAAAWAGQNLQMALQGPWAIGTVAGLFVLLALSNFGLFQIQIPAAIGNRFNTAERKGGSLAGAALLGFSSAFLIGPCVTAPLAGALLYIARTGDTVIGALALFSLGLGKGIPLIVMATIGGRALPRAGAWMEMVRHAFGFLFLATSIWLAAPLVPERLILLPWALLALAVGVYAGGHKTSRTSGGYGVLARSAAVVSLLWGSLLLVGFSLGASDPLTPLGPLKGAISNAHNGTIDKADFARISTTGELSTLLQTAAAQDKPTLVYVTADWCVTCRTIERSVLTAPDVAAALDGIDLASLDVTALDGDRSALMRSLEVVGPPTIIFFDSNSREAFGTRLVGDITAISLASAARAAKASGQRTHVSTLFHHRTGHQTE